MTSDTVSTSSIRAYAADKSQPRRGLALAIANAIGPEHGATLLRLWDFPDLADGFLEEWREAVIGTDSNLQHRVEVAYRLNRIEYGGRPLSNDAIAIVGQLITNLQQMRENSRPPD